ncbi:MAG: HAMP domain-containing histidine kinase [Lachnospiraceae bacterium]|nr:HAMP domain-containing histidine kinase [Lachnospiraceae bacterium]
MLVWAVVATVLLLVLIFIFRAYRRQIRNICRQMAFLEEQKTNLLLGSELPYSELNELTDRINACVTQARESERTAEKRNKALKEVITGLSHDIRTPLTSLSGYFQLLEGSYGEGKVGEKNGERNDEQRRHYISVIRSRIDSLDDMLEELFTFSRLTDEDYVLETAPMDFKKSVYDTVFSFYDNFNEKGIKPEICFCEEALPIQANEEAVRRILQNMIKNVLVHGESAVRLTLAREECGREEKDQESNSREGDREDKRGQNEISQETNCQKRNGQDKSDQKEGRQDGKRQEERKQEGDSRKEGRPEAVFTCENRVNNPEEIDAARVFDRFYKNDAARTHTSTGLGLSIAKEIAERMGGKMEAEVVDGWFTVRVRFGLYGFEKTSIKQ